MGRRRGKPRRVVTLCKYVDGSPGKKGRRQLFAFGWDDVAALLGVHVKTAQLAARNGRFDPRDLESLAAEWMARRGAPVVEAA